MSEENILQALAEIHRTQIVLAKKASVTSHLIPDGYAYAINHSLCPIFHTEGESPFDGGYKIKREFVDEVLKYCNEKWQKKEKLSFYGLEGHFDGMRWELICILRYAFLAGRFDESFFIGIDSECPVEAHGINDAFDSTEIDVI